MNAHPFNIIIQLKPKWISTRLRVRHTTQFFCVVLLLLTINSSILYSNTQAAPILERPASLTNILQAEQGGELTILGSMSGLVSDVEIQGDYAFAAFGPRLMVIDISNPDELTQVTSLSLLANIDDIELSPPYLVALSANTGLTVIDISNPLEPKTMGAFSQPWNATGLAIAGDFAYVITRYHGIQIIDLSDPQHPFTAGVYYPYTLTDDFVISGEYAYVAGSNTGTVYEGGIKVVDLTDPLAPVQVGGLYMVLSDYANITIGNGYLYLTTFDGITINNVLRILDISSETVPILVSTYLMQTFVGLDIALAGEYAYLAGYIGWFPGCSFDCQGGLLVLNIADPAHPSEIGRYISAGTANNVALSGNRLLLTRQIYDFFRVYGGELQSIDISNPAAPASVSTLISPLNRPGSIVVDGNVAYIADQSVRATDSALRVVDTSSLKDPILLGSFEVQGDINDLAVVGDNAYLAELPRPDASYQNTIGGGFRILDVSNPQAPIETYFYNDSAWQFLALDVQDNYAYLIGQELCPENYDCHTRLWILDVTNPGDPQELGLYDINGYEIDPVCDVVVQGSYAYLALRHNGLWILDISDPAYPSLVSSYQTDDAVDLDVAGDYAYIADSLSGVSIINVQNPANPIEITRISSISAQHIEIAGDKLYVTGGLRVFDVTDPASPIELANFPSGSHSAIADDIIYLTSDPEGLFLLSLSSWIKGTVLHPNRMPAVGVSISADDIISTTTTTDGIYLLDDLEEGDYTIIPSYPGYTFSPTQLQVNLPPSVIANFTMLPTPVSIALSPGITTTLSYTDTQGLTTSVLFLVGAVSTDTQVVLTPTISTDLAGYAFTGHAFDLAAYQVGVNVPDLTFSVPVSITIHYSQEDIALITDGTSLRLWWWDGYSWQDAEQTCQPPERLSAKSGEGIYEGVLCKTGLFSLMGQTRSLFLPVISNRQSTTTR